MGCRGNIVIHKGSKPEIFLYTYWRGRDLKKTVQKSLQKHAYWDDAPYLARIVFCDLIGGDFEKTTGFGVTGYLTDNEHPLIILDVDKQEVREEREDRQEVLNRASFTEFAERQFTI